ncbi:MAG: hypothetical protein OXU61_01600 [Gammaproteobacteria bacterium]|nr:hypothetical protein [Gammaproteobacteria bacterium]
MTVWAMSQVVGVKVRAPVTVTSRVASDVGVTVTSPVGTARSTTV